MEHFFELPVSYEGKELTFNGRLVTFGYSYKFYIVVNGEELVFEKDDSGDYRVVAAQKEPRAEKGLLESIIVSLAKLQE